MSAQSGSDFLLRLSDGATPPTYRTLAGMRTTQLRVTGEAVVITHRASAGWCELLSGAGVRAVSVAASGLFLGSAAEAQVRAGALAGTLGDYELAFAEGERLRGRFLVQQLDYAGDHDGERTYAIRLESSGPVVPA